MSLDLLRKSLQNEKVRVGQNTVLKILKQGKASVVFLAKNCTPELRDRVLRYANISGIKVVELDATAEDIGSICKKQFSINILATEK